MKKFLLIFAFIAVASCDLLSEENISPFVSNGTKANLGEFPYQVVVGMFTGIKATLCSGTLIKHKWVLTTAACLNSGNLNYTLIFGTVDLLKGSRTWQSGLIPKSNFKIHPDYNSITHVNNIGLIYVEDMPENLTESTNVAILDLPSETEAKTNLTGRDAVISGYGVTNDQAVVTEGILYHTTTKITTNDVCKIIKNYNVTDNNLCIIPIGNSSVCGGDQGSAMTVEISSKKVLVGVSSIITEACTIGLPAVYENVFHHREWIYKTINGSSVLSVSFSLATLMIMMVLKNIF